MNPIPEIPVFFTIDDSYAPFLAVALHSAVVNSNPSRRYRAIILHENLAPENQKKLAALASGNFAVDFVPMEYGLEAITDRMSNYLRCDYFTLTIYFRLFIPTMFPQYDKAIYIDSDVVVTGDLAELYDIPLEDNFIGACPDHSVVDIPELARYMENAVGVDRYHDINSGVLLMNLKKLREAGFDRHFLNLLTTYHFDCIAPDQDYLNAICAGKIHYLPPYWDAMPTEGKPPMADARLIHYNLFSKPWCYDGVQYDREFWQYARGSGFLEEIKAFKANYSDEQKKSDADCLALLVRRGDEIWKQDVTFKKMQESGVKIRL